MSGFSQSFFLAFLSVRSSLFSAGYPHLDYLEVGHTNLTFIAPVTTGVARQMCQDRLSIQAAVFHDFCVRGAEAVHHVLDNWVRNSDLLPAKSTIVLELGPILASANGHCMKAALFAHAFSTAWLLRPSKAFASRQVTRFLGRRPRSLI